MEYLGEFVVTALGSGAVAAVLLGCAAWASRAQISHWLNKDMELLKKQYQAELQAAKASHERDLETYKVGLIAETERYKAIQAIKTAGAIRMVEKKHAAIDRLHTATEGIGIEVLSALSSHTVQDSPEEITQLTEMLAKARLAVVGAETYLEYADTLTISSYCASLGNLLVKRGQLKGAIAQAELESAKLEVFSQAHEVSRILRKHITAILEMR